MIVRRHCMTARSELKRVPGNRPRGKQRRRRKIRKTKRKNEGDGSRERLPHPLPYSRCHRRLCWHDRCERTYSSACGILKLCNPVLEQRLPAPPKLLALGAPQHNHATRVFATFPFVSGEAVPNASAPLSVFRWRSGSTPLSHILVIGTWRRVKHHSRPERPHLQPTECLHLSNRADRLELFSSRRGHNHRDWCTMLSDNFNDRTIDVYVEVQVLSRC